MPASAPLVPVRPAPRSLKPSPGPSEIFADGLAIEIRRDDRVLYDSPLEGTGFEPSVPLQEGQVFFQTTRSSTAGSASTRETDFFGFEVAAILDRYCANRKRYMDSGGGFEGLAVS